MIWARLRPWLLPGVILVVVVLLAIAWNRSRQLADDLEREREAAELRAKGQLVEAQQREGQVRAEADRLAAANADLALALAQAKRAAPGARPVSTAELSTGARPVAGAPRPVAECPVEPPQAGVAPEPALACQACLLAPGDVGEVRVAQVELQTQAGNHLLVGRGACWRLEPPPVTELVAGVWQAPLSRASEVAQTEPPRWGAGVMAFAGRDGWAAGPALALPPLRLFGLQGEALLGAGVGPSGAWQVGGSSIVRW